MTVFISALFSRPGTPWGHGDIGDTLFTIRGAQFWSCRMPAMGMAYWSIFIRVYLLQSPNFRFAQQQMYIMRADYCGGWSGESIDFAVFFEIWKWFAHEATNHDCPEYYIFYRDVVSFQENALFFCLALWKRTHVYIQWFWCLCNEFCIVLLYILPYVCIYTVYIHTIWHIYCFFTIVYVSR